jgi:hypothetical protein
MHAGFLQLQQSIAGSNANIAAHIAASLRHAANAFSPPTAAAPNSFAAALLLPAAAEEGAVTGTAASTEQESTVGEPRIFLRDVHHSVTSMYNEWHGIGNFLLSCPTGGLYVLESEVRGSDGAITSSSQKRRGTPSCNGGAGSASSSAARER